MSVVPIRSDVESCSTEHARDLTDKIKTSLGVAWELIKEAYTSRAWAALGYESWDDYCSTEFGTNRLRLPREERREVVGSLREAGLSVRAIAAATGTGTRQVQEALRTGVVPDHTSDDDRPEPAPEPRPVDRGRPPRSRFQGGRVVNAAPYLTALHAAAAAPLIARGVLIPSPSVVLPSPTEGEADVPHIT